MAYNFSALSDQAATLKNGIVQREGRLREEDAKGGFDIGSAALAGAGAFFGVPALAELLAGFGGVGATAATALEASGATSGLGQLGVTAQAAAQAGQSGDPLQSLLDVAGGSAMAGGTQLVKEQLAVEAANRLPLTNAQKAAAKKAVVVEKRAVAGAKRAASAEQRAIEAADRAKTVFNERQIKDIKYNQTTLDSGLVTAMGAGFYKSLSKEKGVLAVARSNMKDYLNDKRKGLVTEPASSFIKLVNRPGIGRVNSFVYKKATGQLAPLQPGDVIPSQSKMGKWGQ